MIWTGQSEISNKGSPQELLTRIKVIMGVRNDDALKKILRTCWAMAMG